MKYYLLRGTQAACASIIFAASAWAGNYAVIVNKDNNHTVDKALVVKIYTGDARKWPDGGQIVAIDLADDSTVRADFTTSVVDKSVSSLKSLWAQNIFSGKSLPPKVVDKDEDVKKMVSENKNAIGYIKPSSVDSSVKVILR